MRHNQGKKKLVKKKKNEITSEVKVEATVVCGDESPLVLRDQLPRQRGHGARMGFTRSSVCERECARN